MLDRFGSVFVQIYGQGESPMTITYLVHASTPETHLDSAGVPHPGIDVRIVDADDQPLPADREGEVCVRGDVVMRGYWNNPAATERTLRGGWLHTGDIGRFDPQGNLFLLDRSNDVIISGGTSIYPREVEEVLLQHPAVAEVVVPATTPPATRTRTHRLQPHPDRRFQETQTDSLPRRPAQKRLRQGTAARGVHPRAADGPAPGGIRQAGGKRAVAGSGRMSAQAS